MPLEVSVSYFDGEQGSHQSLTENLSSSGMCLKSNGHLRVGSSFRFLLGLPHEEAKEITGRVRWQSPKPGAPRVGIQFSKPIECSLPLSVVEEAMERSVEQINVFFDLLYQSLSEACVWVDSAGAVTKCDERFLNLLGYTEQELTGRPLSDFAVPDDQERLSLALRPESNGSPSPIKGLFRMKPKGGPTLLSRLRTAPKPPWATSTAVCIEHIAEFGALFNELSKLRTLYTENASKLVSLKDEKHQADKMMAALKDAFPGWVVFLNADFSIQDVTCLGKVEAHGGLETSFRGMNLREATGLLEAEVDGTRLDDALKSCATSGQEFGSDCCHYPGRAGKKPDLFPAGTFNISITPITDLHGTTSSLIMFVVPTSHASAEGQTGIDELGYFQRLFEAAAAGLTVQHVLGNMREPFTSLLARLNLLRHKFALGKMEPQLAPDHGEENYAGEIGKIEWRMERLSKQLEYLLTHAFAPDYPQRRYPDVNECLARAIRIVESADAPVHFSPQPGLPGTTSLEQDPTMIFIIFLLLARDCVSSASDKTIICDTEAGKDAIMVNIRHKAFIRDVKYTDILLDNEPLETLLVKHRPSHVLDTLLCYASTLLKKNHIGAKINNVPGQFSLSLHIPQAAPGE